jgi:hypothetical protein
VKIIRQLISSALFLTLLVLGYWITATWTHDPLDQLKTTSKKTKETRAIPPQQPAIRFNPVPPAVLPDLDAGYIFNESRTAGSRREEELTGKKTPGINIREAFYVGSIIIGDTPKGMLSYPAAGMTTPQVRPGIPRSGGAGMKQIMVEKGDDVGGYTVSEILPGKIVFTKDSETVEKFLNDPDKKRSIPPPSSPSAGQPAGSKVRTVGGGTTSGTTSRPAPAGATQSQPGKPSPRLSTPSRVRGIQAPPSAPPAQAPPPKPASSRRMTPEEIEQMEKEIEELQQK